MIIMLFSNMYQGSKTAGVFLIAVSIRLFLMRVAAKKGSY
jgi:hypothetical protein